MRLAVIPARGGSKRIPRKNIKDFCGQPVIAYSINVAHQSGCFDRIIVSTDDEEIAAFARQYGAEAPFIRPADISDDYANTASVIAHAIKYLQEQEMVPEYVCCIYATAPFILASDIVDGLKTLQASGARYVFSATNYPFPTQRAFTITDHDGITMCHPEHWGTRSQDLPDTYHDAGQFYWGQTEAWLKSEPIFSSGSIPVMLPRYRVQDIDTPEDWTYAEMMFRAMRSN